MKILIVSGGKLTASYLKKFLANCPQDYIIAADSGLNTLEEAGVVPNLILGDYDSLHGGAEVLKLYQEQNIPILKYKAEKNFTDTEAALDEAIRRGGKDCEISILGACGGRLDHFLGNLQDLVIPLRAGVRATIIDEQNRICLLNRPLTLKKSEAFGKYISFLPFTERSEGVTLRGFKYPLDDKTLVQGNSLGISNEITEETAEISLKTGILIMVESRD